MSMKQGLGKNGAVSHNHVCSLEMSLWWLWGEQTGMTAKPVAGRPTKRLSAVVPGLLLHLWTSEP